MNAKDPRRKWLGTACHGEVWLAQNLFQLPVCTTVSLRQTHFLGTKPVFSFWDSFFFFFFFFVPVCLKKKKKKSNRLSRTDQACHQANRAYQRDNTYSEKMSSSTILRSLGTRSLRHLVVCNKWLFFYTMKIEKMRPSYYSGTLPKGPLCHTVEASKEHAAVPTVWFYNSVLIPLPCYSSSTPYSSATAPKHPKLLLIPPTRTLPGSPQVLYFSQRPSPVWPRSLKAC